jgi:nucleotide-binding universal stress UspA family protein
MKVLFATDGSPYAMEAARYLTKLKFHQPLEVVLLTVSYDPHSSNANTIQPWFPEWIEQETKRVEADHGKLEALFVERCESVTRVRRDGDASRMILEEAAKHDVDLIVIGARGHSLIGRLLLGSVSDNVATHAKCSVLVVRPTQDSAAQGQSSVANRVILAYDGSTPANVAISELLDLDWAKETEVTLFSVAPIYDLMMGEGLSAGVMESQEQIFKTMKAAGQTIATEIAAVLPRARSVIEQHSHVGDAIVTAAEKDKSELIIIGDAGHGLLHDMFLGSTTKYVLRHAHCSVWISRRHRTEVVAE